MRAAPGSPVLVVTLALLAATCTGETPEVTSTEDRTPCATVDPDKRPFYGDLHVHAAFSFDARNYDTVLEPDQVWGFAKGQPVALPPLGEDGMGTRVVQLDRPLDFAALTEHGEFLGEIALCTTPGSAGYDSERCEAYHGGGDNAAFDFGLQLSAPDPARWTDLCGEDGSLCRQAARTRWQRMQAAAEAAYDTTDQCSFTAFVGYEYTNTADVSNLHRNVVFRDARVPDLPVTHFEAPTPEALWGGLRDACHEGVEGCDVLVLPHNSNLSNGKLFPEDGGVDPALRAAYEPVVEVFQHKGDSECRNGFPGVGPDPECDFEKLRPPGDDICAPGEVGAGGMRLWGCSHQNDFVRNVLKSGMALRRETGIDPYRLGFIGSTDTHNGTPGLVADVAFPGHVGLVDDTPEKRLGDGNITHDAFLNTPGGLAAVWAPQNTRHAIFDAIRSRETFATSGPRIPVRLFGGDLPADWCAREDRIARGYDKGVPMGGVLEGGRRAPRLAVEAWADPGTERVPGNGLERLQIIKVEVTDSGAKETVIDVIGERVEDPSAQTCAPVAAGVDHLCATWQDPDYDADADVAYYARVLEVPTCRWSTLQCNALDERPPRCDDSHVPEVGRQRAWSSPIWVLPRGVSE